jgi:hypothetical protein
MLMMVRWRVDIIIDNSANEDGLVKKILWMVEKSSTTVDGRKPIDNRI